MLCKHEKPLPNTVKGNERVLGSSQRKGERKEKDRHKKESVTVTPRKAMEPRGWTA